MLRIYNKLDKWWINEIEIPISAEEIPEDYDRNDVCGGQAIMLSIINEIVFGNAGDKYKELSRCILTMIFLMALSGVITRAIIIVPDCR